MGALSVSETISLSDNINDTFKTCKHFSTAKMVTLDTVLDIFCGYSWQYGLSMVMS
jgi:hypothetical protein